MRITRNDRTADSGCAVITPGVALSEDGFQIRDLRPSRFRWVQLEELCFTAAPPTRQQDSRRSMTFGNNAESFAILLRWHRRAAALDLRRSARHPCHPPRSVRPAQWSYASPR